MPNYRCRAVLLTVAAIAASLVYASISIGAKTTAEVKTSQATPAIHPATHTLAQRRSAAAFKAPKSAIERCQAVCRRGKILRAVVVKADHALARSAYKHSPMRYELVSIVKAARAAGVSPFFLLSIAGNESTFGFAPCCGGGNAWGWAVSSTNFKTFAQGAGVVAEGLRKGYLNEHLLTVDKVSEKYNKPHAAAWAGRVGFFMTSVFRVNENGLRWQDAVKASK